jgi:hypothetical protein
MEKESWFVLICSLEQRTNYTAEKCPFIALRTTVVQHISMYINIFFMYEYVQGGTVYLGFIFWACATIAGGLQGAR